MSAYGDRRYYKRVREDFVESINDLSFKRNLHRGCLDWAPELTITDSFDIAQATQLVYEDFLKRILRYAKTYVNSDNLVLMGGCALNCLANRITGRFYKNTWIMPNPGDAGSAVGAVLAHTKQRTTFDPFIGYDMGHQVSNAEIVDFLLENKICGVARGRAEFGPRALGNRSLIADPRGPDIKDRVNAIKQRQEFRPFAPVILEELHAQYFDMPCNWANSRYMQTVASCRHPDLFPAIVHRDGTSRVQTVPKDGSRIRELLEVWYERTGCPMLLNTSLNIKGQPMVNDRSDAELFERTYGIRVFT
jgi:carbamoyltransferase